MGEGETMHMGKTGVEKTCGKGKTGSLREDKRVELKAKIRDPRGEEKPWDTGIKW